MNLIDAIIVDETLRDAESNGVLSKIKTAVKKQYGIINKDHLTADESRHTPPQYADQTEDGYVGLPPPLG